MLDEIANYFVNDNSTVEKYNRVGKTRENHLSIQKRYDCFDKTKTSTLKRRFRVYKRYRQHSNYSNRVFGEHFTIKN